MLLYFLLSICILHFTTSIGCDHGVCQAATEDTANSAGLVKLRGVHLDLLLGLAEGIRGLLRLELAPPWKKRSANESRVNRGAEAGRAGCSAACEDCRNDEHNPELGEYRLEGMTLRERSHRCDRRSNALSGLCVELQQSALESLRPSCFDHRPDHY